MSTDPELLRRARAGDREAFAALTTPLEERLTRAATLLTDASEAPDLVQEALTRAFSQLERYEGRARFSTWVYGILLNLSRQHRRKKRPAAGAEVVEQAPAKRGQTRGVLSSVLRRELAERMELAIGSLPEAFREAFVLHYVEGLPYAEIAQLCDERAGTLRTRAHRARALLRAELGSVVDTTWVREERADPGT